MTNTIAVWLGILASAIAIIAGAYGFTIWVDRKFTRSVKDVLGIADDDESVSQQLRDLHDGQEKINRRIDSHMDTEEAELREIRLAQERSVEQVAAELRGHERDSRAHQS